MSSDWYNCLVCGAPGGHGNLQCPNLVAGSPPYERSTDWKLDRIIQLLEQLLQKGDSLDR